MKTYLKYQHSTLRTLALPVFTTRQAVFLLLAIAISVSIALATSNDGVRYFAAALIFSSIGVLSISAPAFIIMDRRRSDRVEVILKRGGWKQDASEINWNRSGRWFSKWENDQVCLMREGTITLIFGPYYTLRILKRAIGE